MRNAPSDLGSWYKSVKKTASKEGYADTLRTKCTIEDKRASFKCWDAERKLMTPEEIRAIEAQHLICLRGLAEGGLLPVQYLRAYSGIDECHDTT